jgi:myosin heavy subunit
MSADLVDRDDISETAIMDELRRKFLEDEIYSSIGPIIIAVNPYKDMPDLYSQENMDAYMAEGKNDTSALYGSSKPPHVWAISQSAYQQLKTTLTRQAIVISGESGGNFRH